MYRPAIVPIIDRDEYLLLLSQPCDGVKDLVIVHDTEEDLSDIPTHQAGIPIRPTRVSKDYESLGDNDSIIKINHAFNRIRKMIQTHRYRRVIFLADPPISCGHEPLFARGELGYDVQLYITELLYELGVFVTCQY